MRSSAVDNDSPGSGGRLRPSLKWQAAHERGLNSGPRPSRFSTEAGATTQAWLKKEFPTKKDVRCAAERFGAGKLNASWVASNTVAAPAESVGSPATVLRQPERTRAVASAARKITAPPRPTREARPRALAPPWRAPVLLDRMPRWPS